jgi:hypothetical protein
MKESMNNQVNERINALNTRNNALLAMRPAIPAVERIAGDAAIPSDSLEYFLHTTLRPILKLQHSLIVSVCAVYIAKYRGAFLQKSTVEQQEFITNSLKKDTALRNLVVGLCVGCFTSEELFYYIVNDNNAELNKRIIELAAKRVSDSLAELKMLL